MGEKTNSRKTETQKNSARLYNICHVIAREHQSSPTKTCYNLPAFKIDTYGNIYGCIYCDVVFYSAKSIKNHLGAIHNDFHYFCDFCGEFFSNDWKLNRHQNVYRYNCEQCEYSSNHYSQFREHSSRAHKIEMKPKFRSENKYNKSYECEICGYQVLRPHMYKKHMRTVHDIVCE